MNSLFAGHARILLIALTTAAACDAGTTISGKLQTSGNLPPPAALGQPIPKRTGKVAPQTMSPAAEARVLAARDAMLAVLDQGEFVPGDVIVAYRQDVLPASAQSRAQISAAGLPLQATAALGVGRAQLYRASDADRQRTIEMIEELNQRPDVLYAQPNYIYHPLRTPNDEFYEFQWHYEDINLPQAWDITVGSPDTIVAVVDTGILFDENVSSRTHPDFIGKVLPGFDFISDPRIGVDGNARDDNAFDDGDEPNGQSSYHGSHVAGTVAASTNDGRGAAGVNWSAQILPIRALGAGGGITTDILDGILWSAGFQVQGVPNNPTPADVINLSLGGGAPCSPFEQQVYDTVAKEGVIVVVAAGNENQNAANVSPASCTGVITVGAVDTFGQRAPYSNFGLRVDVMAPGGDTSVDSDGDGFSDGVLSMNFDDASGQFDFKFFQGTSMASPHVAGVVSLMKGLRPELTTEQAVAILQSTARPLSASDCNRPDARECGAGLIDAAAAIAATSGNTPLPTPGILQFDPEPVDFGSELAQVFVSVTNTATTSASWSVKGFDVRLGDPGALDDGTVFVPTGTATSGTLAANGNTLLPIGLDRSKVSSQGIYAVELVFDVNGAEERLLVRFSTLPADVAGPSGPTIVAAFMRDETGEFQLVTSKTENFFFTKYSLDTEPGENMLIAWSDDNGSLAIDLGDHIGIYPEVQVAEGQTRSGIDIAITPYLETSATSGVLPAAVARMLEDMLAAR
jgi:serine protease